MLGEKSLEMRRMGGELRIIGFGGWMDGGIGGEVDWGWG